MSNNKKSSNKLSQKRKDNPSSNFVENEKAPRLQNKNRPSKKVKDDEDNVEDIEGEDDAFDNFEETEDYEEEEEKEANDDTNEANDADKAAQSRESHLKNKELRVERRGLKPNADLIFDCKKNWEKLRNRNLKADERHALVQKMLDLIDDKVVEITFRHDSSRIIQACLKYGNLDQRNAIADYLKSHYLELAKSKYGKFIAIRILKYCPKKRDIVIKEFYGQVRKMIKHKEASSILEDAYSQYGNAAQRFALLQEFYGPEFVYFKEILLEGQTTPSLDDILKAKPEKKDSIMKHLFQTLSKVLDKGTLNHTIVHKGLLEFFTHANKDQIQEMIELLKELVVEILHTKEGSLVAIKCFLYATPKDRKAIMKSFKPFAMKIAKEEYGHIVLVQILDCVDDTVLASKSLLSEFLKNLSEVIHDKFARRILLSILTGRSPKFLPKDLIDLLAEHDEIKNATSKKDPETRQKEFLQFISSSLIDYIAKNANVLLKEAFGSQMISAVMLSAIENKKQAFDALIELAKENTKDLGDDHVLSHILSNRVYKAMASSELGPVEGEHYSTQLLSAIKPQIVEHATSYGSFVVLSLFDNQKTNAEVKKLLKPHAKAIQKAGSATPPKKGSEILAEKLLKA